MRVGKKLRIWALINKKNASIAPHLRKGFFKNYYYNEKWKMMPPTYLNVVTDAA